MDVDDAVMLTDVLPVDYQAAEMGGIQKGDTVVIFGAGPSGSWQRVDHGSLGLAASSSSIISNIDLIVEATALQRHSTSEIDDRVVFIKKQTDSLGGQCLY